MRLLATRKSLGVSVTVANDGQQALRALTAELPDLIFCDLRMPVLDGFEFIEHLRKDPKLSRLQVVAVTAPTEPADLARIWDAGSNGYQLSRQGCGSQRALCDEDGWSPAVAGR
jgi:CheY-like chemotaxis protein